ncbi:MAG TPA: glycosyltransferase [Flavobacterium sp.]|nr:glycosyltransferase [Flavobacterium sp.]
MTFCIITHVNHHKEQNNYFAYAPYVREMNIWLSYVDKVIIVAPLEKQHKTPIDIAYTHDNIDFRTVASFNVTGFKQLVKTIVSIPKIGYTVYKAMQKADHIHLRCPGNMGLIGCIVQLFFPKKKKTAKYAGNWDLNATQPLSYKLQKWILNNTLLTKNMQVLVYGEWEGSSKNIKPFFTATYTESEKQAISARNLQQQINFVFVGTLAQGKRPLYAVQLVEKLLQSGRAASLQLFGEGNQREELENYIAQNNLKEHIRLQGNQSKETVLEAYKQAHFLILASKSEGWPKVVAEAMFWGCLPLATAVSCVPNMLAAGKRGLLLSLDLDQDVTKVIAVIDNQTTYEEMAKEAVTWSRQYTVEKFESEIKELI